MTKRAVIMCNTAIMFGAAFLGIGLGGQTALGQGTSCDNLVALEQRAAQQITEANAAMQRSTDLFFEAVAEADPERAQILFELSDSEAEVSGERRGLANAFLDIVEQCNAL